MLTRLERVGVPVDRPFGRLSKGQRKQVELALALGHSPALLVLDDPTLGLDPLSRKAFFGELVDELAGRGTSVLLTTHDLDAVEGIADAVAIVRGGRLLVAEPLEALKGRFRRLMLRRDEKGALAIAPAGQELVEGLIELAAEHERRVLEPFGLERSAELKDTLKKMIELHRHLAEEGGAFEEEAE